MEDIVNPVNLYSSLVQMIQDGAPCAIATVVETRGSAPQKPGSSAVFGMNGLIKGTVGGGMTEFKVQVEAIKMIQNQGSAMFQYDLNEDISEEDSVVCGGGMSILLDANPEKHLGVFKEMRESISGQQNGVLLTFIHYSAMAMEKLFRFWITAKNLEEVKINFTEEVNMVLSQMLNEPKTGQCLFIPSTSYKNEMEASAFLECIPPLPELLIAGAGHVGKALSHLGKRLDFRVIIWDDREEFANNRNLPDADEILSGDHQECLKHISPDKQTYIVIVTRGHKNDSDILRFFIDSNAGYLGMIGSKSKVAQMREKFLEKGWATPEKWNKIHTPIGLKIHSKTVQEIAVSIAAELIKVRYEINR